MQLNIMTRKKHMSKHAGCVDGKHYASAAECYRELNLKGETFNHALRAGKTMQEAADLAQARTDNRPGNFKTITYDGVFYSSYRECCEAQGVSYSGAWKHLKVGLSPHDAIKAVLRGKNRLAAEASFVNGVFIRNPNHYEQVFGTKTATIAARMRPGMTFQDLHDEITKAPRRRDPRAKGVTVFDCYFDSIGKVKTAFMLGDSGNHSKKMQALGLTLVEALELMILERQDREKAAYYKNLEPHLFPETPKWLQDVRSDKLIIGQYTPIKTCTICSKIYAKPKMQGETKYCSDDCREVADLQYKRQQRKQRRAAGKDNRGKPKKRHKAGAKIDKQVTAKSVAQRFNYICQLCYEMVEPHLGLGYQPRGWSVGHIIPASLGGSHTWDNVQCECIECNQAKGATVLPNGSFKKQLLAA